MSLVPSLQQIQSGNADDPSRDMTNWNAIRNVVNGQLDNDNIRDGADIEIAKTDFTYVPWTEWVPVARGTSSAGAGTYSTQEGRYTQIGKTIHFTVLLTWTAHTGTGNLNVTIPTQAANVDAGWPVAIGGYSNIDLTAGSTQLTGTIAANGTVINFRGTRNNNTDQGVALPTAVTATISLTGTYEVP